MVPNSLRNLLESDGLKLVEDFAAYLRNGPRPHSEATIETYLYHVATFVLLAREDRILALPAMVNRVTLHKVLMKIPRKRTSTRRNLVSAVKKLAMCLADLELLDRDVAAQVHSMEFKFKAEPQRPYLKEEELATAIRRLMTAPSLTPQQRLTNMALLGTMALTGLRNSELCNLRLSDIDLSRQTITVVRGKGAKRRVIGIPDRLMPLLRLYLQRRPEAQSDHAFVTNSGTPWNRQTLYTKFMRMNRATNMRISPHRLRRTFATHSAHRNIPLDKIQVALGHSDIKTTREYVQTDVTEIALDMRTW